MLNDGGRSWSNLGEHREHGEHRKDGKCQPDDLKHSNYDSKHSICASVHSFCQPDNSKHYILQPQCRRFKKSEHTGLENMILDQLNVEEHLAKCKAQVTKQNIILQKEW